MDWINVGIYVICVHHVLNPPIQLVVRFNTNCESPMQNLGFLKGAISLEELLNWPKN